MPEYHIIGVIDASKSFGTVSAPSQKKAVEKAWQDLDIDTPNLCWHCAKEMDLGDITELIADQIVGKPAGKARKD